MAIVANTFTRHDAVGVREDLSDVIYDISPMDTPVLSGIAKSRTSQTLFEWQVDELDSATTANAHVEGDDITAFPAVTPTTRVGNYVQISRKLLILSDTLEAVDAAGRRSELAYQMAKRGREIKRDMESIIFSNQAGNGGGTATARATAALGAWLQTNVDLAGDGANSGHTSGVPAAGRTDGTQRALTETIFKDVIQTAWESGANIDAMTAYAGAFNKGVISGFSGVVTRNYDISSPRPTAVIAAVDVYVSDYGVVRISPHRYSRARDLYFIDMEYLALRELRPFRVVKLAKTGDAEKRMLLTEWGLQVKNEAALALAADLTTS